MKNKLAILLLSFYALSRLFIWVFKPPYFSEIIYSYMPYAHLWADGETPYLKHWYEYPPATIPLFYVPHVIDMSSLNTPVHLNYAQTYRLILLLMDVGVFVLIWKVLNKYQTQRKLIAVSVLYYILTTAKAHHFIYDTMDLAFTGAMTLGVALPLLIKNKNLGTVSAWLGYWLAVAFKYINAPLGALYAFLELDLKKVKLKNSFGGWVEQIKEVFLKAIKPGLLAVVALLIVWGVPLLYFRSSLLVSFVYHQNRGLQIDSAAGSIVRLVNEFTHSEEIVERYKNYDITGPVSDLALQATDIIFPLSIAVVILYGVWVIWQHRAKNQEVKNQIRVYLTILYLLAFMISAKVLSTPFMLWLLPLLALYPFSSLKEQLKFYIPSAVIILMSMTGWPNPLILGGVHLHVIFVNLRWMLFLGMLIEWLRMKPYWRKG